MSMTTRKRYGAEFEAKVALEAVRGELTLSQLGAKYGVHQTMINARKKQGSSEGHRSLSIDRRRQMVAISRLGFYYQPSGETELNLGLMRLIDEQHLRTPYYGARQRPGSVCIGLVTSTRLFLQRMSQNL